MQKTRVKFFIKAALTAIVLLIIFTSIDLQNLLSQLNGFNWLSLIPLFILIICFLQLGAINNWLILRSLADLSLAEVSRVFFISASVGMFTPAYVGEFASMSFLLKQKGISISDGLSVPTIDKVITLVVNTMLFAIGLFLYFPETSWMIYAVCCLGLILPLIVLANKKLRNNIFALISKRFPWASSYLFSCASFFLHYPKLLILNFLVSLVRAVVGALCIWVILLGFGISPNVIPVLFVNFVVRMVTFIPLTINGLGLLEGTAMVLFKRIGIAPELSFLAFFIARLAAMVLGFFVITWVTWKKRPISTVEST